MKSPLSRSSTGTQSGAVLRLDAETAASTLPPLLVAAERVASTVAQGVHGRRRVGQGDSFWQFRRYQPGDPAQAIDWRQSAKTQNAFVRENEWEAAQSVWLWCDGSESMDYRSRGALPTKAERTKVLALALASLLVRGGERVAMLGAGMRPATGRAALNRVADWLLAGEGRDADTGASPATSLPAVEPMPRYSNLVLMGDFLSPPAEVSETVRRFASGGVKGHMLQVLDPAEDLLPFKGRVRFEGFEGEGAALIGRVEMVREDYAALMTSHRQSLADIARSIGWTFATHRTDKPPQTALLALYGALSREFIG